MNVNPANAAAIQFSMTHEFNHLGMRNGGRPVDAVVSRQELMAASTVAHEQLSGDKFVCRNLIEGKQLAELLGVRRPIGQEPNPDRGVHQNHSGRRCRDTRVFAPSRHIFRFRFAPAKASETVVGCASHQSFEAQTNRFGIRQCSTSRLCRVEEFIIDVQRLLHSVHYAICVGRIDMALLYIVPLCSASNLGAASGVPYVVAHSRKGPCYGIPVFTARRPTVIIGGSETLRRRQVFA